MLQSRFDNNIPESQISPEERVARKEEFEEALRKLIDSGRFDIQYRHGKMVISTEMQKELPFMFGRWED